MKSQSKPSMHANAKSPKRWLWLIVGFVLGLSVVAAVGPEYMAESLALAAVENNKPLTTVRKDRAERRILMSLEDRRVELEKQEQEVAREQVRIEEAQASIESQLEEMKKLRSELNALIDRETAYQEKKYKDMAKIHSQMSASKSAVALAALDDETAVRIMFNLKSDFLAKILPKMTPERSLTLSRAYMGLKPAAPKVE